MTWNKGFRGYISSRPFFGERTAQHVQNLVIRDYARRRSLPLLLSATEYTMTGCTMILEQLLDDLPNLDGIICFSLFMLPHRLERRQRVWTRLLDAGCCLHAAHEGLVVANARDVARIEDIWLVKRLLPHCPTVLPSQTCSN
ncbi:MAG: LIC12192 family sporadic carbohydrate cluster protein [Rhodospirillaceae bacterium]